MSRDDRLSKLFRDNQHKLDEQPSPAVWERIETRLDKHKRQTAGRIQLLYRYAAVAAAIVLIVAMVGLFRLGEIREGKEMVSQAEMPPVESLEEQKQSQPIAQIEKRPAASAKAPVEEPSASSGSTRTAPAQETKQEQESAEIQKIEMKRPKPALRNRANEELSLDQVRVNNRRYAQPPPAASIGANTRDEKPADVQDTESERIESEEEVLESIQVAPNAATKAPAARSKRQLLLRQQSDRSYSDDSDASALSMHRKLRKLDWLLGTWKGSEGLEGESYEEWILEGEATLQGRGYHVIRGDKVFSERMRIVYMPKLKRVYYVMQAEYGGEELAFPLIRATGNRVVFEQLDMSADEPTRIILERTDNGFRTIIENTNGELKANQQSYLQNRNHLSRYKAKRYLQRYNKQ